MDNTLKEFIFGMKEELMLFHLLNDEEVEQVISYLEVVSYPGGSTLFREGEPGGFIAFILSGLLEVKKQTEFEGRQIVLGTLKKGSFIGETSLINAKEPRAATVVVVEDSQLVILKSDALESLMEKYPYIGIKILKGLIRIITIRLLKALDKLKVLF